MSAVNVTWPPTICSLKVCREEVGMDEWPNKSQDQKRPEFESSIKQQSVAVLLTSHVMNVMLKEETVRDFH